MATIEIADNDARVQYTQAVTANTTQLTIDFPFFDLDDINVIVTTAAGVDTTLSRGTGTGTFAVTGTAVDDGFSGGYVTLGDSYSAGTDTFTILRDIPVARTTDFPTSGPFNISSLNTELDKIIAIEQELETKVSRTLGLAESDTSVSLALPNLNTRKGTVLAFNNTTGIPEAGPNIGQLTTIANLSADIGTLADIEDGTVATDAISDTAAIASDVTTVAGITSNVSTVAGISANVTTVANDQTDIGTVATDIANVNTVSTDIANVNTVAGISSNVTTVAGVSANVTTVAGISANVTTVAGDSADIGTLAAITSDITSLANALGASTTYTVTVSAGVYYLDGVANPILTFDRGNTYIFDLSDSSNTGHPLAFKDGSGNSYTTGVTTTGTAGSSGAQVQIDVDNAAPSALRYYCTVHGNGMGNTITVVNSNLALVASNITSVNSVAGIQANIATVAGVASNVTTVAGVSSDVTTVAGISANTTTVAGISSDVTTVAGDSADIQSVAGVSAHVATVAGISSDVSAVGAVAANVTTVANNLTNVNNFADTYFVSASAPSSPTTGDLWFDSTNNIMKVYGGSGFQNAGSSVNGTAQRSSYTATAGQTTFAATYDAGYVDVYLNGIKLIDGTDFTATSGTSIVLSSGAAVNDTVDIIGYGTFELSNFSINDANDVNTSGISNGQVLAYNSTSSDFEPTTITSDLVDDTTPQLGADLDTNGNAIAFGTSKWTIELSTDDLIFKYNGVAKIKFASDGEIVTVDDVTAFGSI